MTRRARELARKHFSCGTVWGKGRPASALTDQRVCATFSSVEGTEQFRHQHLTNEFLAPVRSPGRLENRNRSPRQPARYAPSKAPRSRADSAAAATSRRRGGARVPP